MMGNCYSSSTTWVYLETISFHSKSSWITTTVVIRQMEPSKNSEWVSVFIPNRVDYTKAVILMQRAFQKLYNKECHGEILPKLRGERHRRESGHMHCVGMTGAHSLFFYHIASVGITSRKYQ